MRFIQAWFLLMQQIQNQKKWIWRVIMLLIVLICMPATIYWQSVYQAQTELIVMWFLELVVMDCIMTPFTIALIFSLLKARKILPYTDIDPYEHMVKCGDRKSVV